MGQLGESETVVRGVTQIEFKLTGVTPLHGAYREARFDDCRLYLNPRRHPIRLVVKTGAEPYRGERLRIELRTIDGTHKVSEGYTDQQGAGYLSVDSPYWIAFPTSATMRIFRGENELARSVIESRGVESIYPSDVWVLNTDQIR